MKCLVKLFVCVSLLLMSMQTGIMATEPPKEQTGSLPTQRVWPGRPDGNGDGSEEYLGYSCEVNWEYYNITSGDVSELQGAIDSEYNTKALAMATVLSLLNWTIGFVSNFLLYGAGPIRVPGDTFTSTNYKSSDCGKSIIVLKNSSGTVVKTYTVLSRLP